MTGGFPEKVVEPVSCVIRPYVSGLSMLVSGIEAIIFGAAKTMAFLVAVVPGQETDVWGVGVFKTPTTAMVVPGIPETVVWGRDGVLKTPAAAVVVFDVEVINSRPFGGIKTPAAEA